MKRSILGLAAMAATGLCATVGLAAPASAATAGGGNNDASCRPTTAHPNPVVFLHGLGATYYEDTNVLQADAAARGYCTYSLTYGAPGGQTLVGGLESITKSAPQIAAFIAKVKGQTGAAKVDIVGHSEGGFQSLYVTKTQGISGSIGKIVAIAPPAHGTSFANLYTLAYAFGIRSQVGTVLKTFGCAACNEIGIGGSAVKTLNTGPIAQPGVDYTIITSKYDELVGNPDPASASFVKEPGVKNLLVQDYCPLDITGHIGEAYDTDVWQLVYNAIDPAHATKVKCGIGGFPG